MLQVNAVLLVHLQTQMALFLEGRKPVISEICREIEVVSPGGEQHTLPLLSILKCHS